MGQLGMAERMNRLNLLFKGKLPWEQLVLFVFVTGATVANNLVAFAVHL